MVTCDPVYFWSLVSITKQSNKTLDISLSPRSISFASGHILMHEKLPILTAGLRNHRPLILQEFLMRTRQARYLHTMIGYVWRDAVAE